jgi:hypothetical protein
MIRHFILYNIKVEHNNINKTILLCHPSQNTIPTKANSLAGEKTNEGGNDMIILQK